MSHHLIVGAGRSALGAAKLLLREGHRVTVSDIQEKFPAALAEIRQTGAQVVIGPQGPELLDGIDALVVSPGLSPKVPLLEAARKKGLPILSEIDVALKRYTGHCLGVTGTNGKSTSTLLLAHFLKAAGLKAEASGNIGIAPSLILAEGKSPEALVLELSSYQLDYSESIPTACSLFMSFAPDHMERHGTMEAYFAAKWKLVMATRERVVLPRKIIEYALSFGAPVPQAEIVQILFDDEQPLAFGRSVAATLRGGQLHAPHWSRPIPLPTGLERHNQLNVAAALIAAYTLKPLEAEHYLASLPSFQWLPYRFQTIGHIQGQPVINDSKSTNVESTEIALTSLESTCLLMLGGAPKGESYAPLLQQRKRIGQLVTFGAAADQLNEELKALGPLSFKTMKEALAALPGLIRAQPAPLLFSPANASFDEFQNFEERGAAFNAALSPLLDPKKS